MTASLITPSLRQVLRLLLLTRRSSPEPFGLSGRFGLGYRATPVEEGGCPHASGTRSSGRLLEMLPPSSERDIGSEWLG
jgi:hypothetical protein